MFEGLANFIVKRHKAIVIFWLLVFLISLPGVKLVNNVIVYQESEVSPLNTASQGSQKVINEEFPSMLPRSSAIIVIQGENANSSELKSYLLTFEDIVWYKNSTGKLNRITDVMTIYSVYRTRILEPVVTRLSPMLPQAEDYGNETVQMLFELPTQFFINFSQLESDGYGEANFANASGTIYSTPAIFLEQWKAANASMTDEARTEEAYNSTIAFINADELPYLQAFVNEWNLTFYDENITTDEQRAQRATEDAAKEYFELDLSAGLPSMEKREQYYALTFMNVSSWNDSARLHDGTIAYKNVETTYRVWESICPGLNATEQVIQSKYLEKFFQAWNDSFFDGSPGMSPLDRAEKTKNETIPPMINESALPIDNKTKDMILDAIDAFNLTNWQEPARVHNFTMDMVVLLTEMQFNFTVPEWFLEDVYSLGPNATEAQVTKLSRKIIENHTLDEYPIPIPAQILNTFLDPSNTTMLAVVGFNGDPAEPEIQENVVELRRVLHDTSSSTPEWKKYKTYVTGLSGIDYDTRSSAEADARLIEPFTAVLVIIFIALYFRSGVAPWVPLATVGMAFVMSQAAMFIIGSYIAGIHYSIRLVTFTMIMGAGSDYSIFIVARYREELMMGKSREDAIKTSIIWAGESIATSGATVMVAFLALVLFSFPLIQIMGLCLAVSIGISLLMVLTLIPSFLYWIGDWAFWPTMGKRWERYRNDTIEKMKHQKGYFFNASKVSLKHARAITVACLLISIPTTYLAISIEPSYDFLSSMADSEAKKGVDAMAHDFGAGNILPTYVVVKFNEPLYDNVTGTYDSERLNATDELADELANLPSVFKVTSSSYNTQTGARLDQAKNCTLPEIRLSIGSYNRTVMLTVVLKDQPSSSEAVDAIGVIRALCEKFKNDHEALSGAGVYVGGSTAGTADISATVMRDFPVSAALVLVGVYFILLIVLGSVMIPLRLMLTILLSISWTLALSLVIFLWWLSIPVLWILPLLLFVILMGLGLDYDIFLMTRIKEEVMEGRSDEEAISRAVEHTGSIITICGAIMAGAFGTMMLSTTGLLKEFGFGLCFAILLDATVVRIYLVPAIMILLKKWNWWGPSILQKVIRK